MTPDTTSLTFTAEIKQTGSKKLASNDVEYKVVLLTQDVTALSLGALDGETMVQVTVEPLSE